MSTLYSPARWLVSLHANIGGYLLVGLGCETANVQYLIREGELGQSEAVPVLIMQQEGGTVATVESGVRTLGQLLPQANDIKREAIPASELIVGMECGGSDGSSGITANPTIGAMADLVVGAGGTAILAETLKSMVQSTC